MIKLIWSYMKTSKTTSNQGKISVSKEQIKIKNVTNIKFGLSEEKIREKAKEFYHQRIAHSELGTSEDDWLEAEAYLKESNS